jgi:lipoprotein-releasing system permease protein
MRFESFIAFRYLRSKRHQKFVSFISFVSFTGVTIGVMTLVAVLSVMNGFQETIRDKIINTGFHAYVTTYGTDRYMRNWQSVAREVRARRPDVFVTPFFKGQVIVKNSAQRLMAVDLHGMESDIYTMDVSLKKAVAIDRGKFRLGPGDIMVGSELARFLGVSPGDSLEVISPEGGGSRSGLLSPRMKRYRVAGLFKSGYYEYDLKLVFVSLSEAQNLFNRPGEVWGLGIKIKDIFQAGRLTWDLKNLFGMRYQVFSWMMFNRNLFVALKNEKTIMGFIVFLIIIVAAFNIAASLVMMVMEKKRAIGILMAMGATRGQILRIFLLNGMLTGGIGTFLGTFLGVLLSLNLDAVFRAVEWVINAVISGVFAILSPVFGLMPPDQFHLLAWDVYYLDKLPVAIHPSEILIIAIGVLLVSFLFSLIPAIQASKLDPVEAIRYE